MNTKTLLLIFTLLVLTMISSLTFTAVLTIDAVSKPNKIHYTINVHHHTNTYVTINEAPNKEVNVTKPKEDTQINGHNNEDIRLLAKIINAEAKGEPFEGKVAVGNIILNRVKSSKFPDTIKEVIYQPRQFQPVSNGAINEEPSEESVKAARESLKTNLIGDALYFYNPDIATDSWIRTRNVIKTIGSHSFAL